jgi:AraC-like DNA-binding protein
MNTRILCFFLFSGLLNLSAFAQDGNSEPQHTVDSLNALLPSLEDGAKYSAFAQLQNAYAHSGDVKAQLACIEAWIDYAHTRKNAGEEGKARDARNGWYYNNYPAMEPSSYEGDMTFWREHEQWEWYFNGVVTHLQIITVKGNKEEAFAEAQKQYAFAKEHNLNFGMGAIMHLTGQLYYQTGNPDESLRCLREAINRLKKEPQSSLLLETYNFICQMLIETGSLEEALIRLQEWEALMTAEYSDRPSNAAGWLNLSTTASFIYSRLTRFDHAENYLREAEKMAEYMGNPGVADYLLKTGWLMFYQEKGDYANALRLVDEIYPFLEGNETALALLLKEKATIADRAGNYGLASGTWRNLYLRSDSIQKIEMAAQLDELRTVYEVDKITLEKERNRSYMLLALAGCLLLVIALGGWILYSRRLSIKNRGLVRQILEQDRLLAEKEQQAEELRQYRTLLKQQNATNEADTGDDLWERFKRLMQNSRIFTNPDLNWKSIMQELNTNEVYLRETVKQHFGCTIGDYINELRLNHARLLLVQKSEKYTVEAIAFDAGFNSRGTFYRLFYKRYGLSPIEYQKQLAENN